MAILDRCARKKGVPISVLLLSGLAAGCSHTLPPPELGLELPVLSTGLHAEDSRTQTLFRVQYQGPDGSGALRLVLKLDHAGRYLIETKDRLGRGLWRIEVDDSATLLVDDRRKTFCTSEAGLRIPEIAIEALPLEQLPAVLLGRLPDDLEPMPGSDDYRDPSGRKWTVDADGAQLQGWTLWKAGEPWLWWRSGAAGEGILSHKRGTQLRWKRAARESLRGEIQAVALSANYRRVECDAWAEPSRRAE